MKKYINSKKNNKGFSSDVILYIIGIPLVIGYFLWPIYKEKAAEPKFQALKELTQKVASSVNTYNLTHGTYPNKMSELNTDLHIAHEKNIDQNILVEFSDNILCMISKKYGEVSCTQKILGEKIGLVANVQNLSMQCATFTKNTNNFTNRLCRKEAENDTPICSSTECMYKLK